MPERLEALRTARRVGWGELCEQLGIKRSMLHYLRTGERKPSPHLEREIFRLEQDAGLVNSDKLSPEVHAVRTTGDKLSPVAQSSRTLSDKLSPRDRMSTAESRPAWAEIPTAGIVSLAEFQALEDRLARALEELLKVREDLARLRKRST